MPSWTGNITRWDWRHLAAAGETDSSGNAASYQQRSELFSYDGLNRLSGSAMTIGTGATATSDSRWSERNIRYNLDGNLLHLERYQEMVTDNGFIQWNGSPASSRMQYFCSLPYKRSAGETILL